MNLVKHARATRGEIGLTRRDGCLELRVEGDGIGFAASHAARNRDVGQGYGLQGVCERLALVDGGLTLEDLHPGARVRLWIPVEPESRSDRAPSSRRQDHPPSHARHLTPV
jgi:signal transduction histidine kinase